MNQVNGKTSTGMQPNVEGLLCYLVGWITGIIFFIIEKENKFVQISRDAIDCSIWCNNCSRYYSWLDSYHWLDNCMDSGSTGVHLMDYSYD